MPEGVVRRQVKLVRSWTGAQVAGGVDSGGTPDEVPVAQAQRCQLAFNSLKNEV